MKRKEKKNIISGKYKEGGKKLSLDDNAKLTYFRWGGAPHIHDA